MGALPSRETHQRGLYSHRHGRNRKSEIILIPLTPDFFPSADCPLFQHLYHARDRRTAKYYFRALRPASASTNNDFLCRTYALANPEGYAKLIEQQAHTTSRGDAAVPAGGTSATANGGDADATAAGPTCADRPAAGRGAGDAMPQSYTDTPEGLYQVLVRDNALGLYDTDEALRAAYAKQLRQQHKDWDYLSTRYRHNPANVSSEPYGGLSAPSAPSGFENVPFDAFVSGYVAAKQYLKGKRLHTHTVPTDPVPAAHGGGANPEGSRVGGDASAASHVTSPAAYYIRPLPCAIASRWDPNDSPETNPLCVPFGNMHVKIMGMFGTFPATVPMRHGRRDAAHDPSPEAGGQDDEADDDAVVEQHMLKGTMFVDKDIGDQILGYMVLLATHMYVRQCVGANIRLRHLPMLPFFMRFPMSNTPMLQFVREFRVRLRTLIEAGTANAGKRPRYVGISGLSPQDLAATHNSQQQRWEQEGYLYEKDIPEAASVEDIFSDVAWTIEVPQGSKSTSIAPGNIPVMMISGFNVQSAPLCFGALNNTGYNSPRSSRTSKRTSAEGAAAPPTAAASTAPAASTDVARLLRRKNRFRLWIEDGHVCVWASAAYARRACLILAQQLNTTVDTDAVPEHRAWEYVGLLRGGTTVPAPMHVNDVMVVAEDIPEAMLWQGDVLRCCTPEELEALRAKQPLPLPCAGPPQPSSPVSANQLGVGTVSSPTASLHSSDLGAVGSQTAPVTAAGMATSVSAMAGHASSGFTAAAAAAVAPAPNYTTLHPSNVHLQEVAKAPPGAFWVRASGGLDDSLTNLSTSNVQPQLKLDRQLQHAAHQRAKKLAVASAALSKLAGGGGGGAPVVGALPSELMDIDRREGTLNLEGVVLSWVRLVSLLTRGTSWEDPELVRDRDDEPIRIDRHVIRRFEHDGIRFFIGVTPRFAAHQRCIERALGEVTAMEERHRREGGTDGASGGGGSGFSRGDLLRVEFLKAAASEALTLSDAELNEMLKRIEDDQLSFMDD